MKKTFVVVLSVLFFLALMIFGITRFVDSSVTGNVVNTFATEEVKEFYVDAFRFGYSPDVIEVNKDDRVKIIINNLDVMHGIIIPELGVRGNEIIEFTADKEGEFEWYCAVMCGEGHREMQGRLIVR